MPHTQTTIYVNTNTNPHQGITPADVGAVLVRSTQDVGQLCGNRDGSGNLINGGINKWAKYKPVRLNNCWDTSVYNPSLGQYWWKGSNGLCGIDADLQSQNFVFTVFSSFVDRMIAGFNSQSQYYGNFLNWDYAPPRGLRNTAINPTYSDEPYRLLDFNGYHHDAVSPAGNVRTGTYDVVSPGAYDYTVLNYGIELSLPSWNLQVNDFGGFSVDDEHVDFEDCYVGVLVINTNNNHWSAATMAVDIAHLNSGDNHVKLIGLPLNGTAVNSSVKAIPFISTIPMTEDEFPEGVNYSNIAELEQGPHPETGAELDGAWLSAFGVAPVTITLHRFGQYDIMLDTEIEYANQYITGDLFLGVGYTPSSAVSLGNIEFGLCDWNDVQLYKNGSLTRNQLYSLVLESNTVTWQNVVIPAGQYSIATTLQAITTAQGGYGLHLDDPIDTSKDWVLVGFPSSATSWNAAPSVSMLNYAN